MTNAPGVTYTTYPGTDLRLFRCVALSATITTASCAQRHRDAQLATRDAADRLHICRGCSIGACHAGVPLVHYNWLYGSEICPRCGSGTTRMIHKRRCVSCYNREREFLTGKNAKGTEPIALRHVQELDLTYTIDGGPARIHVRHAADRQELVAHVMRITPGALGFEWRGDFRGLRQGRLL